MNDPVLNRKMFRNKARHLEQMRTGNIVHALTGLGVSKGIEYGVKYGPRILPAAHKAWKSYRAARAVPNVARAQPAKEGGRTLWPFGKGAGGPKSVAQVFRHKFPKTTAGITGALGADFIWEGGKDIYQGIRDKEYGKAVGGLGSMALGFPIVGRGAHIFSKAKKWTKGTKWAAKIGKHARAKSWKDPKLWGPLAAIGGGAGYSMYTGEGEAADLAADEQNLIFNIARKLAIDEGAKEINDDHWKNAIEIYENQFAAREGQVGIEGDFDRGNPNEMNIFNNKYDEMVAEEINPKGVPSGDEAEILAAQENTNKVTQTEGLKNKFDNSTDGSAKARFLEFRQSISDLTGAQGPDRDLLIMKLASGMMSNKTSEKGLRGFMDVVGQSTGPVTDTAIALNESQRKFNNDLAVAFLKVEAEKAKEGTGMKMAGAQKRFIAQDDPDCAAKGTCSPYGFKVFMGQYDTATGQIYEDMGDQQYVLATGNPQEITNVSQTDLTKHRSGMLNAATAYDMSNWVRHYMDNNLKGWEGNIKLKLADWIDLSDNVNSNANKYTGGMDVNAFVAQNVLSAENLYGADDLVWTKTGRKREGDLILEQYREEEQNIKEKMPKYAKEEGWDINENQLAQLTKAALIENRLKYIVANANKSQDRLTRWDIENAENSTQVLPFINIFSGKSWTANTINSRMDTLMLEMQASFAKAAKNYQQAGGTNNFILNFKNIPYIQKFLFNQEVEQQSENEMVSNLESIPIPGI